VPQQLSFGCDGQACEKINKICIKKKKNKNKNIHSIELIFE
jgi:hypothetical protein